MTQNTNGFCDVTEFLYSPNEANELLNNENVIQSSDNFFLKDLEPNVIDCSDSNQSFQLIQQDLNYDPGTTDINHSRNTLNQKSEIDSLKILYPNLSTCSHSSSNSPLAIPNDDLESQTSFLNSFQNISASNSNKLVYENLSAVVR